MPILGVLSMCCQVAAGSIVFFLTTAAGLEFNEQIFGRLYTAGMILMIGIYLVIVGGFVLAGFALAIAGCVGKERPVWLAWFALALNSAGVLFVLTHI